MKSMKIITGIYILSFIEFLIGGGGGRLGMGGEGGAPLIEPL
jgi:hypothetical protein